MGRKLRLIPFAGGNGMRRLGLDKVERAYLTRL